MKDDKREIVSLRHRNNGNIHFIRVYSEDEECLFETGGYAWVKTAYHLRRNLATMPHEDAYRRCEIKNLYGNLIYWGKDGTGATKMIMENEGGRLGTWIIDPDITFLDETPETYEYNGKTYLKSEFDARIAPLKPVEEK